LSLQPGKLQNFYFLQVLFPLQEDPHNNLQFYELQFQQKHAIATYYEEDLSHYQKQERMEMDIVFPCNSVNTPIFPKAYNNWEEKKKKFNDITNKKPPIELN
jgi:hypothetical protein